VFTVFGFALQGRAYSKESLKSYNFAGSTCWGIETESRFFTLRPHSFKRCLNAILFCCILQEKQAVGKDTSIIAATN